MSKKIYVWRLTTESHYTPEPQSTMCDTRYCEFLPFSNQIFILFF